MRFVLVILAVVLSSPSTQARIWNINPEGTGDAPTIQAAVDSSADGDEIVLANGTYSGFGNYDIDYTGKAIQIRSAGGDPQACSINCGGNGRGFVFQSGEGAASLLEGVTVENGFMYCEYGGGIYCRDSSPTIERCVFLWNTSQCFDVGEGGGIFISNGSPSVVDCIFLHNSATGGSAWGYGGGISLRGGSPLISGCTFFKNYSTPDAGGAIFVGDGSPMIERCIMANNKAVMGSGGGAIACGGSGDPTLSCCNLYDNWGGDWVGCIADQLGTSGNFSARPIFCDPDIDDLTLDNDSPCLPGNHPDGYDCGLIGALDEGCSAPTATENASWGSVKSLFR